jgi:Tfp pilus assembly protein PilV
VLRRLLSRLSKKDKRDDRGESLVELLVAMVVMSTAVIALLGALATAIRISEVHRYQAAAGAFMREFAERLESEVAENAALYQNCTPGAGNQALKGHYEGLWDIPLAQRGVYHREVVRVRYGSGTSYVDTCPAADSGVQLVSLRVWTTVADRPTVSETIDITIRKRCRPGDPVCA